jgi:hypothetical protein
MQDSDGLGKKEGTVTDFPKNNNVKGKQTNGRVICLPVAKCFSWTLVSSFSFIF